jgi:hypothetical protein
MKHENALNSALRHMLQTGTRSERTANCVAVVMVYGSGIWNLHATAEILL